ncbi:cytochrome P450 [Streptomyces sp. DW26H14]|uniref:cytochrome P450 n=1 Tax=Streptomyces sp. DW26H14 TaxID=3435395 RepID=UPI00403D593A
MTTPPARPTPAAPVPPRPSAGAPHPPYRLDPAGGCPHAANAELLARGDVAPVVLPGEVPAMAVLGHEALKEFLNSPDVAKGDSHFTALRDGRIPEDWPLRAFASVPGMTTADGTEHRRLRSPVTAAFTPRRVEALRPTIEAMTAGLLDDLERAASDGDGTVDLRRDFALPLPLAVICELLGVDPEHRRRMHALSNRIVSTDISPEEAGAANADMVAALSAVVAARRADPGDDLTSALIAAAESDGGRLSEAELVGTLLLLIIAGHETTLNLIGNGIRALCAHRDQLRLVLDGRATWQDVVEETLRWDSPVSYFPFRYPTRDLTVDGTLIPAGTPVLAGYSAAGRDKAAHGPDADRFDITRTPNRHISFGHGPHFCLGSPLARLEATVALEQLFTRFPGLELTLADAELPRHASFIGNGIQHLLATLHTGAPAR